MKTKYSISILIAFLSLSSMVAQTPVWQPITDINTGIHFSMPPNTIFRDSLAVRMYAAEDNALEAIQVHIFENAQFDTSDIFFNEALLQENNDTLRAITRLVLFATESDLISIDEVYTDGVRGIELGINYQIDSNVSSYFSFIRYYLKEGNFVAFTWTGDESILPVLRTTGNVRKDTLFDSIHFQ
jgi:hypothetical protein